jgi:protein TonB
VISRNVEADAESGGSVPGAAAPPVPASQPARPAHYDPTDIPPPAKKILAIIPLPDSELKLAECPYPADARRQLETGTVVLLVHVSPEGSVVNTHVESSSGSPSLDQGAVSCVQQFGQFAPKPAARPGTGYWGRMKFNWSFGG